MHDESQYANGHTIFGTAEGSYSAVIDKNGNEIWTSGNDSIIYYNFLDDGRFFGARYSPNNVYQYIGVEFSLTEGIVWQEPNYEFVHHEFMQLPWGDYMGIAHETQLGPIHATGTYQILYQAQFFMTADGVTNEWPWWGDRLVIWDKDTKEVKWSWSSFDHFDMSDYEQELWDTPPLPAPYDHYDWTHMNAFYFDDSDSSIYISTRNLSRITKLQYPSGEIIWNMGRDMVSGDVTFGHDLGFSHQHSLSVLENGNILIFDNGKYSVEYWGASELQSRALEIEILENTGQYSAEIIWEYILPPDLFSPHAGNVQKLNNGNYLITSAAPPGISLEVNTDKEIVWEANYSTYDMWRASRIDISGCTHPPACNYDETATVDDGSCEYYDCAGECGGAVVDECGVCDGNGWDQCDTDNDGISNLEQWGYGAYSVSAVDVPDDQGGWINISFHSSFYDTDTIITRAELYTIELLDSTTWVVAQSFGAYGAETYSVLVPTLLNNITTEFRIIANMDEGNFVCYENGFGASIDNIYPAVPTGLMASMEDGEVELSWDQPVDADFQYFTIYRNDELIVYSTESTYIENEYGEFEYYITATDANGNESDASASVNIQTDMLGDLNYDGALNVLDVVILVNNVMEDGEYIELGDVNGDGYLNILDVVTLVNWIVYGML